MFFLLLQLTIISIAYILAYLILSVPAKSIARKARSIKVGGGDNDSLRLMSIGLDVLAHLMSAMAAFAAYTAFYAGR